VTSPGDVIGVLEQSGWHADRGTLGLFAREEAEAIGEEPGRSDGSRVDPESADGRVLGVLTGPMPIDSVIAATGLSAAEFGAALTRLELQGLVRRRGPKLEPRD